MYIFSLIFLPVHCSPCSVCHLPLLSLSLSLSLFSAFDTVWAVRQDFLNFCQFMLGARVCAPRERCRRALVYIGSERSQGSRLSILRITWLQAKQHSGRRRESQRMKQHGSAERCMAVGEEVMLLWWKRVGVDFWAKPVKINLFFPFWPCSHQDGAFMEPLCNCWLFWCFWRLFIELLESVYNCCRTRLWKIKSHLFEHCV